ncbi:penicillin-binding protein 1A [Lysobacter soyae]|uniref:Penicillin-binding protein 1A n=1 Tax=Lysobacter soyae TaxID=2764185 RepID=A0ABX8WRB5_9GAMM|nr:PBP1A family penicillin-binding protein [Lysobacter sp. CJ11]QYR53374.1 PBP1A family penicillin-binding protein [Lysobacter sp. CJ11]
MPSIPRVLRFGLLAGLILFLLGVLAAGILYWRVSSKLPDVSELKNVELQEPLTVYAADGRLMGLFGEGRRYPVDIKNVPEQVKNAFIAAEDADFYHHGGVDFKGLFRAVYLLATTDDKRVPGGSTITMQVAKQFYQENQARDYSAKFSQILLARKIEANLSKDEILELYLNKSFFGNRNYGIAAAAEYYYGKKLEQLTLGELTTLVGTPKFPTTANPLANPERNEDRRNNYILPRMVQFGYVSQAEADAAAREPMHAGRHQREIEVYAPYVAEMVRQEMLQRYGKDALEKGYRVTTTIDPDKQLAAELAVRQGLRAYDHRHGWRGAEKHFDLPANASNEVIAAKLNAFPTQSGLRAVIVTGPSGNDGMKAVDADGNAVDLPASMAASWPGRTPASLFKRGDVARVRETKDKTWVLDQLPKAQASLISIDPMNGALKALIGGFSFNGTPFNRATQARRQPGSSFKPFLYAASFEKGYNPTSIVLDAPVVFRDRANHVWRPQNDGGGFSGPIALREALVRSKNLVSVRLLDAIGVDYARRYISHFGFDEKELPRNLSMSLGAATLRPIDVARGYAAFANGGFRVNVWFIDTVVDSDGKTIFKENPALACRGCTGASSTATAANAAPAAPDVVDGFNLGGAPQPAKAVAKDAPSKPAAKAAALPAGAIVAPRAIDERVAYQLNSMMRDVVKRGTATAARSLNREDVGGKTGSTNDHRDAWFTGFGGNLVTVVWVGRDDDKTLGYGEYGGKAALPIWIDYMGTALKGVPDSPVEPPSGMVQIKNGEWIKEEDQDVIEDYIDYSQAPKAEQSAEEAAPTEETYDIF